MDLLIQKEYLKIMFDKKNVQEQSAGMNAHGSASGETVLGTQEKSCG